MKTYAFRLQQNSDLRLEIQKFVKEKNIRAGAIITCVGNLTKAVIRMAGAKKIKAYEGTFEIISLVGTIEINDCHLHIAIADNDGNVVGGHLKNGSIVGVTAEIVIGELKDTIFSREFDKATGYDELAVTEL